jgi:hypothetical protein
LAYDALPNETGEITVSSLTHFAALLPLDTLGHYLHWHFIQISVANFVVIVLMVSTFIAAIFVPFPGRRRRKENQ